MSTLRIMDVIIDKRDGKELNREQIDRLVDGAVQGSIPDYQLSAWLMAVFLQGMSRQEVFWLTDAMVRSGDRVDLSPIPGIKVDKHITGGVGDKTTLICGPIAAACGVPVAKMSGRGLGYTGGTIDKLEAIPGMRTSLSQAEFIQTIREIGLSIIGQSDLLAAADKKLYPLRDVTGTVESIPLIASSIMSKKIASGADAILLDVKTGKGAFMHSLDLSIQLAQLMVEIGEYAGKKTLALVTAMDEPLGYAIGNTLEVIEAVETLDGRGPRDLEKICLELAANMLFLAEKADDLSKCRDLATESLHDGSALACFLRLVQMQGGDVSYLTNLNQFPVAPIVQPILAEYAGYVQAVDAMAIGNASVLLGAGRQTKDDPVDHRAGLIIRKKTGDQVKAGDVLAELHTASVEQLGEAQPICLRAFRIGTVPPPEAKHIRARVDTDGITK